MFNLKGKAVAHISGNATPELKDAVAQMVELMITARLTPEKNPFSNSIMERMILSEISVTEKVEDALKKEAKVVCDLQITEDMLNGGGHIHGGCIAFIIDMCSTLALNALAFATDEEFLISVSQSLNIVYHAPAGLGANLRIVNKTLTLGARTMSAQTEIWSVTDHRLIASGTHIKMRPSSTKANL